MDPLNWWQPVASALMAIVSTLPAKKQQELQATYRQLASIHEDRGDLVGAYYLHALAGDEFGVEASQGITPMPESPPPSEPSIGSDNASLHDAAEQLTERRGKEAEDPDILRYYRPDGKHTPDKESIKLNRGAENLHAYRQEKIAEERAKTAEETRAHVDNLRRLDNIRGPAQVQQPPPGWESIRSGEQPQAPQQQQSIDQLAHQIRNDPNYFHALRALQGYHAQRLAHLDQRIGEAYVANIDSGELTLAWEQAQQEKSTLDYLEKAALIVRHGYSPKVAASILDQDTRQFWLGNIQEVHKSYQDKYQALADKTEEGVAIACQLALAAVPELANAKTAGEADQIIATIQRQNPARGQYIAEQVRNMRDIVVHGMKIKEETARQQQQLFEAQAIREDEKFRAAHPEYKSLEHQAGVALEAFAYMESLGIDNATVIRLLNTDKTFRSWQSQTIIHDALCWRRHLKAKESIQTKKSREASPRVLKPGSSSETWRGAPEKLPDEIHGAKAAAEILARRRARR
jgi:hypothetical protein